MQPGVACAAAAAQRPHVMPLMIFPLAQLPDFRAMGLVLLLSLVGLLCGLMGLAFGLSPGHARARWQLGVAAAVVGIVAPLLGLLLLWEQLETWCYFVPAAPLVPGAIVLLTDRRAEQRGFPIEPAGTRPRDDPPMQRTGRNGIL